MPISVTAANQPLGMVKKLLFGQTAQIEMPMWVGDAIQRQQAQSEIEEVKVVGVEQPIELIVLVE